MRQDVYSGTLKLYGEQHKYTVLAANNYAATLIRLRRFEGAKSLLRKTIPVVRRLLGENHSVMFSMKKNYARAHHQDTSATLDDLREAVTTLENTERIARRVFGGAHPLAGSIEMALQNARAALRARETQSSAGGA